MEPFGHKLIKIINHANQKYEYSPYRLNSQFTAQRELVQGKLTASEVLNPCSILKLLIVCTSLGRLSSPHLLLGATAPPPAHPASWFKVSWKWCHAKKFSDSYLEQDHCHLWIHLILFSECLLLLPYSLYLPPWRLFSYGRERIV